MKINVFLKNIVEYIKVHLLVKKEESISRNESEENSIEKVKEKVPKQSNCVRIAKSIYNENDIKALDKFYLMLLIDHYDVVSGYSEISNADIMKAANCKNGGTVTESLKRLCDKNIIRKLVVPQGSTNRYLILKHMEYIDTNYNDKNNQIINLNEVNIKIINDDIVKKIENEVRVIKESSKDILLRVENIGNELKEDFK